MIEGWRPENAPSKRRRRADDRGLSRAGRYGRRGMGADRRRSEWPFAGLGLPSSADVNANAPSGAI